MEESSPWAGPRLCSHTKRMNWKHKKRNKESVSKVVWQGKSCPMSTVIKEPPNSALFKYNKMSHVVTADSRTCLTQMSHTHIPVRNIHFKPIISIIGYWWELNAWLMLPFGWPSRGERSTALPICPWQIVQGMEDPQTPPARNGEGKKGAWKEEEKALGSCSCIQGTSPLPYYHIRESGPISAFITQPLPPPRISNSAILICFGDTRQPAPLSERKFGLLDNISEQLIPQLHFRPWEVNA